MSADSPVLVYQVGSVGSTSIYRSLQQAGLPDVFHLHRMNADTFNHPKRGPFAGPPAHPEHARNWAFHKFFVAGGRPARIITIVRDPVARNVSCFFGQNFEYYYDPRVAQSDVSLKQLKEIYLREFPHQHTTQWFDIHLRGALGIDVYDVPFNPKEGFVQFAHLSHDFLLIRTETDDGTKAQAIKDFLGLTDLQIERANETECKRYGKVYNRFKKEVRLPTSYLDRMYGTRYARHFYSAEEIKRFRSKWGG